MFVYIVVFFVEANEETAELQERLKQEQTKNKNVEEVIIFLFFLIISSAPVLPCLFLRLAPAVRPGVEKKSTNFKQIWKLYGPSR